MMRRLAQVALAFVFTGCAAVLSSSPSPSPSERAYLVEGEVDAASVSLQEEILRSPGDGEAVFLLADLLDATGHPAEAAKLYFRVIELGRANARFAEVATAASMALVAIRERVPDFYARFAVYADAVLAEKGALPPEAVYELRNLRFAIALRRKDDAERRRAMLDATGCLARFEVMGSFGPRAFETLDDLGRVAPWFAKRRVWPAFAALGPGLRTVEAHVEETTRCIVPAFHKEARAPGLGLARTVVGLDRAGTVLFRLETDASAKVYADEREIFSIDRRARWLPRYSWFSASLPEGNTEISIAVANSDFAPSFSLVAVREDDGEAVAAYGPRILPSPRTTAVHPLRSREIVDESGGGSSPVRTGSAAGALARFRAAVWRKDDPAARLELERLGSFGAVDSPIAMMARAQAALSDSDLPVEVAFETARRLYAGALEKEPRLWEARLLLARAEAGDGRPEVALELVEQGRALCGEEPAIVDRLVELHSEMGHAVEAGSAVRDLEALVPGSCSVLALRLAADRANLTPAERLKKARSIAACDRTSDALAVALSEAQRYDEARREYARLRTRTPEDPALFDAEARAASSAGDLAGAIEARRAALRIAPSDVERRLALADALAARGEKDAAQGSLEEGLAFSVPGEDLLEAALAALDGREPYAPYRIDGLAAVEGYVGDEVPHGAEVVWVLDRVVQIIGRDGSRIELTHNIAQLLSSEAVAEHGEVELPDDAAILTVRAIKADGSVRATERIEGKGSLSLSDLAIGDFVEVEYVRHLPPSPIFPGGFDTGRFFFGDFEHVFHRTEMVLVAPVEMPLQFDPRGGAPSPSERRLGDLRALTWRVRETSPRAEEPLEPDASERLPSIRVTSGASREAICGRVRELLADKDRRSEEVEALSRELLEEIPVKDTALRLETLYEWVMENIVDDGDLSGQLSHIIARRMGSRARAFLGLSEAAGLEGRLAFVRPAAADDTPTDIPDPNIDERVVVSVGGDFVSFEEDGAPFGYLPAQLRYRPVLFPSRCETSMTGGGARGRDTRRVSITVRLSAEGDASAELHEELTGADAAAWRSEMRGMTASEREKAFAEMYVARVWPGAILERFLVSHLDELETPLEFSCALSFAEFGGAVGDVVRATLPFARTLVRDIGGRATRTAPAVLASYEDETVSISLIAPEGFELSTPATTGVVESKWGRAARTVVRGAGGLEIRSEFRLEAGRIDPDSYAAFAKFASASDALSAVEIEMGRGE